MEGLPVAVDGLAEQRGLGRLVLTHRPGAPGAGVFAFTLLTLLPLAVGVGLWADEFYAAGSLVLLLSVAMAALGRLHHRRVLRGLPVLYCLQRGVVLREGNGRMYAYAWSEVDIEVRKVAMDMPPWAMAGPSMFLRGKDGRLLGCVGDPDKRRTITELTPRA
ncbi:hypothetical protein [Streptomyces sp. NPDC059063]|uniref:hypothetical protein n=1 Tax=unclassified Streptomyces TaxID=2593676 RepID=UPI0036A76843